MKFIIINGPNLNILGKREPEIYGNKTFVDFLNTLKSRYKNHQIEYFQSNHEGEIIEKLHETCDKNFNGIILNAAAYTHTSIAIADAIKSIKTEVIEVHISNIFSRESFRHKSYIAPYCKGSISGFGLKSYQLAIDSFL